MYIVKVGGLYVSGMNGINEVLLNLVRPILLDKQKAETIARHLNGEIIQIKDN